MSHVKCPVPFTTLILNPDGRVGSCRELSNHHIVGNIFEQTLAEIWNGEKMRSWRREFLEGTYETCATTMHERACHLSASVRHLEQWTTYKEVQEGYPIRISPDFNGQCNLECNMCDVWQLPNGLYDQNDFWEMAIKNIFPYLKVLEPLSGEPFIQKDNYRLLKIMADINPECEWHFTTNAHWKMTDTIRNYLDGVNLQSVMISLDSLDPQNYARIRKKGRLSVVLKCIDEIIAYRKQRMTKGLNHFVIRIAMTVQSNNWHEVNSMANYVAQLDDVEMSYQKTIGGEYYQGDEILELDKLPLEKRKEIIHFFIEKTSTLCLQNLREVLLPLLYSFAENDQKKYKLLLSSRA